MVLSIRGNPRYVLRTRDVKIKHVSKFNSLGSVITDDGKCDIEILRRRRIAKIF